VIYLCGLYLKVTEICEGIAACDAMGWIYVVLQKPYWRQAWDKCIGSWAKPLEQNYSFIQDCNIIW